MLLLVNVWFWILLVTEFKLLEVPVTLQHLETVGCNWVAPLYVWMYTRVCLCARCFHSLFPDPRTPGLFRNDLLCWRN